MFVISGNKLNLKHLTKSIFINPLIDQMKSIYVIIIAALLAHIPAIAQPNPKQQEIINTYLNNCAYKHHYLLKDWQKCIDEGLKEDTTIAELWQKKALPYWKVHKYQVALQYYDKAVALDRETYLGRRGYLKCLFQKDYKSALLDLENAQSAYGNKYENDHTYAFYIALCYLQLNDYEKARAILEADMANIQKTSGKHFLHYLDYFYLGIIYMELERYDQAITHFDQAINSYKQFSDALYYQGLCYLQKGDTLKAKALMNTAHDYFKAGYSFNEDAGLYEKMPYQVNWTMAQHIMPK